jgi:hypothetical protein
MFTQLKKFMTFRHARKTKKNARISLSSLFQRKKIHTKRGPAKYALNQTITLAGNGKPNEWDI